MKTCTKCNVEKELTEFANKKISKDGKTGTCKICISKRMKEYQLNNKLILSLYRKEHYLKNTDYIIKRNQLYAKKNYEKTKEYRKFYSLNNKEKTKEYNLKNKDKHNLRQREYIKKRKLIDPLFKLRKCISSSILNSFKRNGYSKNTKTFKYLGCTFEEFKLHIEKQFTKGMTWENQGKWHLDHIYPISLAKDEEDIIKLNHYTNFQPLWAKDNLIKSNKIINNIQLKLI